VSVREHIESDVTFTTSLSFAPCFDGTRAALAFPEMIIEVDVTAIIAAK
jgi:hypothetical protein